jgi:hypothetical protein
MSISVILLIIQLAAQALSEVEKGNVVGTDSAIAEALIGVYQKAAAAYQAVKGQPINEALVPAQTPIAPAVPPATPPAGSS